MTVDTKGNQYSPAGTLVLRPSQWAMLDDEQKGRFNAGQPILVPKGYQWAGFVINSQTWPEFIAAGQADFYRQAAEDMQKPVEQIKQEVLATGVSYSRQQEEVLKPLSELEEARAELRRFLTNPNQVEEKIIQKLTYGYTLSPEEENYLAGLIIAVRLGGVL